MTSTQMVRSIIGSFVEILPDSLYFCSYDGNSLPKSDGRSIFFTFGNEAHYESFYNDFGPFNLSVLYRFCKRLSSKLKLAKKRVVFYTSSDAQERVNGAYLVGAYAIINLGMTCDGVMNKLRPTQPPEFPPFRDAAMGHSTYDLHLLDVLRAVQKAVRFGWLNFFTFNPTEYEFYERVQNGDFNWIVPGKVLSFCGPHARSCVINGYPYHAPETYFNYFRRHRISTIVRLNKKLYDASSFSSAGFAHVDLFFVDGSTPSDDIVRRFIQVLDEAPGAVAVHCKAGLGRTGTLIACWMMKNRRMTAAECMGWIRICRPGSIIGPQQQFLLDKQNWCWSLGNAHPEPPVINGNVSRLASKVDDIKLARQESVRSSTLPRRPKKVVESEVARVTVTTSATSTIRCLRSKIVKSKTATVLPHSGRLQNGWANNLKCLPSHSIRTCQNETITNSSSCTKLPPPVIRKKYQLRSRARPPIQQQQQQQQTAFNHNDYASHLPSNTQTLLGSRKNIGLVANR